jgi:hypothetical protein
MSDNLFDSEAFEQLPGQLSMEAVEPSFATDRNGRGWRLVRCYCCRQDFYTDPAHLEVYCPRCMELGR